MNNDIKQCITETIESVSQELRDISLQLHENPELGNNEFQAYKLLTEYLERKGFELTHKAAGLETAFMATFSNSKTGRRVGFASEYDALPGVGHACGHNLIAIAGLACAISMKALMEKNLVHGTVVLYGTPAEETFDGKIPFINKGLFKEQIDYCMMLHPAPKNILYGRMLAVDSCEIGFYGKASHASAAPWEGINALDAMMQGFDNIGALRQQLLTTDRVHGVITNGGKSANVIPDYSSAKFYARSWSKGNLKKLKQRIENCFQAAAMATGCRLEIKWGNLGPIDDVVMNDALTYSYKKYMEEEGEPFFSREREESVGLGSSDFGNFSYVVPAIHPQFAIEAANVNHTKEFTVAAKTEGAHQSTLRAAKCMSFTAAEVLLDDQLYEQVVSDFHKSMELRGESLTAQL